MNAMEFTLIGLLVALAVAFSQAAPAPQYDTSEQEPSAAIDYSRFYGPQKKATAYQQLNLGQWGLPRHLAPKFKRFSEYLPNGKRLDGDSIDSFYVQPLNRLNAGRLEWNFNRL